MKRKFAVFDIDGTYFRSHLYWETTLALARDNKLPKDITHLALELHEKWKKRVHSRAFEDFDYQTAHGLHELVHKIDPVHFDEMVEKVLRPILDHVYMYPKRLKEKLQKQGYFILAISGSRKEEVELFCKHHKFDDWIGQTWHRSPDGKKFTGEVHSTYKDKHQFLDEFITKHNLTLEGSFAIGDTGGDITILEMVDNPIAFNPNPDLLAHAQKCGWPIVLERKSIAYTLEPHNGSYLLAKTVV